MDMLAAARRRAETTHHSDTRVHVAIGPKPLLRDQPFHVPHRLFQADHNRPGDNAVADV